MNITFLFLLALAAQEHDAGNRSKDDATLKGPAARCGTEIPWTASLDEARKRAKETGRPIAWWVTSVDESPMDRKAVLEKYMLSGPFMMTGVVELLSESFIPLRRAATEEDAKPYGVGAVDFIEPGLVFLSPDLKVLHTVDRLSTFSEDWFVHVLTGVLRKAGRPVPERKKARLDPAYRSLAEGKPDPALFEKLTGDEARYFHGAALFLTGRDEEGRAEWKKLREGRWAWKAAAELSGDGPFVRGFETYEALPPEALQGLPSTTTLSRQTPDVRRAVRFLLQHQRGSGVWDDSNYNFGGDDSLPNVYMAVTAMAALALREWGEPEEIRVAIERAERLMRDETRVAPKDADEIIFAHLYRLLYFARTGDKEMMARLVKSVADLQQKTGIWYHEYDNPFVTALAIHALDEARKAGATVPEGTMKSGVEALQSCRLASGAYSYGYPATGAKDKKNTEAAGRSPLCEYALLVGKRSTPEAVTAALEKAAAADETFEKVRKYDDHAPQFSRIGGFFFWYDQYGRAVAARGISSAPALQKLREILQTIPEIDGGWVDSHEIGRTYGTALALMTLKLCETR